MHVRRALASAWVVATLTGCAPSGTPTAGREAAGSAVTTPDPATTPTPPTAPPVPAEPAQPALTPPTDLERLNRLLDRCVGDGERYPLGPATRVDELGPWGSERVFMARMTSDPAARVLLFDADDHRCPAYVVRTGTTARGDFFGEGSERTAALLSQSDDQVACDDDACPVALLVRDGDDAVLSALRPDVECTTFTVKTVRLFANRDSIELRCSAGLGFTTDTVQIYHAFDRGLKPVLSFVSGRSSSAPTDDDRTCTKTTTGGGYTITARGEIPVVEVLEVVEDFDDLEAADPHEGLRGEWTYAATEQRLLPGERTRVKRVPGSKRSCDSK